MRNIRAFASIYKVNKTILDKRLGMYFNSPQIIPYLVDKAETHQKLIFSKDYNFPI